MFPFSKVFLGHPPSSTIIQLLPLNSGVVNPSAANTKVFHENVHLNQFLRLFNKLSHKSFPLYSTVSITVKPWKFGPLLKVGVLFDILEFWQWFWMFRVLRQNSSRIFTVVDAEMRNSGHYICFWWHMHTLCSVVFRKFCKRWLLRFRKISMIVKSTSLGDDTD